jgi:hypothetical protein
MVGELEFRSHGRDLAFAVDCSHTVVVDVECHVDDVMAGPEQVCVLRKARSYG